jgi:hypothetical protein
VVSTEGSWEGGVDGAMPGMIMKNKLTVGDSYPLAFAEGLFLLMEL